MNAAQQAAADRATWPAKEPGPTMMAYRRGLAVAVNEAETLALLELAIAPKFVSFSWGARPVQMHALPACEWAFRALAEMRGERVEGSAL